MTQYLHGLTLVPSIEWAMTRERIQKELSREKNKEKTSNKEKFEREKQWGLKEVMSNPASFLYVNECFAGKSADANALASWKYHVYGPDIGTATIFDTKNNQETDKFPWSPMTEKLTPVPILEYIMDQSWFAEPDWYDQVKKRQGAGKKFEGNNENLVDWMERGFFHKLQDSYVLFHAGCIRGQSGNKEKLLRAANDLKYTRFELAAVYHIPSTPINLLK